MGSILDPFEFVKEQSPENLSYNVEIEAKGSTFLSTLVIIIWLLLTLRN